MRTRQRILDAARLIIGQRGFSAVSIAAVAQQAGVTRQTVYTHFGTRQEMVSQAMVAEVDAVYTAFQAPLSSTTSATEHVIEMVVAGRSAVRSHPVLAALLVAERGNPLFDTGTVARIEPFVTPLLTPLVDRGLLAADDLADLVELTTRLLLSVIAFDSETVRDDAALRAFLTRWVSRAPGAQPFAVN